MVKSILARHNEFFDLTIGVVRKRVDEPAGWSEAKVSLERDPILHGVNHEFLGASSTLKFDCAAGGDLIRAQYDLDGNDAEVLFRYGYDDDNGNEVILFEVDLDFNKYEVNDYLATLGAERTSFEDLVETRLDTEVALNRSEDLNGDAITLEPTITVELHSKGLFFQSEREKSADSGALINVGAINIPLGGGVSNISLTPEAQIEVDTIIIEDLETNFNIPDGVSATANPIWELQEGGDLLVDLAVSFNSVITVLDQFLTVGLKVAGCARNTIITPSAIAGLLQHDLILRVAGVENVLFTTSQTSAGSGCTLQTLATGDQYITHNAIYAVDALDEVFLFVRVTLTGAYDQNPAGAEAGTVTTTINFFEHKVGDTTMKTFINLQLDSISDTSESEAYLIHEATETVLNIITGKDDRLRSNLLGRTDIGYAANGCASQNVVLNGFGIRNILDKPTVTSMSDILKSLRAIYNIGFAYQVDAGEDVIRIEEASFFYQDKEILTIDNPYDYKEVTDIDRIWNEIIIGYKDFETDGLNLLDEPNTEHKYSTPIKKLKKKLELISPFIAGGYTIELQRRDQFSSAPSESLDFDDNVFIINVIKPAADWKSEKDENFTTVDNVFSAETSYNLRISPKRNLLRHADWIKSAFSFKDQATDKVRFMTGKQNSLMETETADACEFNDLVVEGADIILDEFADTTPGIYIPINPEFKAQLNWRQISKIKEALQGAGTDEDYGFIRVKSPITGEFNKVYILKMEYTPSTQETTFKTLKRPD